MAHFLKELPPDWLVVPFGEVVANSAFGPRFSGEFYDDDGNVATLRTTDMDDDGRICYETMPCAKLDLAKFERHLLRRDDLVITRSGTCGIAGIFREFQKPVLPGAFLLRFRLNERADVRFFRYFFNSKIGREHLLSIATGAVQQNINITNVEKLQVPLPPLPVQRRIVAILSAYGDLIENNLRRIKILEEMAQTIYREWFVKFRFPGHQKVKMVNSPLGRIPEGWEMSMVGDNITVVPRKNKIKTGDYLTEGVIPVIDQGKDFIAGYIDNTFLAYDGPLPIIVFGDHTCVLKWVDFRFAVGADGTQLIQPEYPERLPPRFLFYTLQFVPLEQFGYQRHFKYLKEAKILIPSGNLARKFEEVVSSNTDLILNLQRQNLNLRQTRDLLLPKLISGELDVSELDITIPEANA